MGEEEKHAFDSLIGGYLANACMAMEIYRKNNNYGSLVFDHAVGVSKAVDFLERVQFGLFTNADDDNLHYAQIALDAAGPLCSADCLDILLDKYVGVLQKMKGNEKIDSQDFSGAKALLYKLACRLTGFSSVYPGMVRPD